MPTAWSVLSVQFPPVDPIRLKIRLKPVSGHEKTPETQAFREFWLEVTPGFEPGNEGFADPCLTTWLCHRTISPLVSILYRRAFVKHETAFGYLKSDVGFFCFRVFEKGGCSKVLCGVFSFRAVRGKVVAVKFFVGFRRRM